MIVGVIFLLVGLGLAAGSGFFTWRRKVFLKTAVAAVGTVIGVSERRQYQNGTKVRWYYPTVRFQTAHGQIIDHASSVGSRSHYTQGQQIPLSYNPQNPYSVKFGAPGSFLPWLPMIIVGGIGAIFAFVGFGISVVSVLGKLK